MADDTPTQLTEEDGFELLDTLLVLEQGDERTNLLERMLYGEEVALLPQTVLAQGLGELFLAHSLAENWDRALEVVRDRNAAGYESTPDGRVDEAEMLLKTGERDAAAELLQQVHSEFPDDVWVGNNAGMAYQFSGDPETALTWYAKALQNAIDSDDPEGLAPQLIVSRYECLRELGRTTDDLQDRAEAWMDDRAADVLAAMSPEQMAAAQAQRDRSSSTAAGLMALGEAVVDMATQTGGGQHEADALFATASVRLSLPWFPRGEFERALEAWPDGMARFAGFTHEQYTRAIEADMQAIDGAGDAGVRVGGVVALGVDVFTAWAQANELDESLPETRARYAIAKALEGLAMSWPPERNDLCWCASGAKYKKCCGTVRVPAAERQRAADANENLRNMMT